MAATALILLIGLNRCIKMIRVSSNYAVHCSEFEPRALGHTERDEAGVFEARRLSKQLRIVTTTIWTAPSCAYTIFARNNPLPSTKP